MQTVINGIGAIDPILCEGIISDIKNGYPFSEISITISENLFLHGDYYRSISILDTLLTRDLDSEGEFFRGRIHKLLGDNYFTQGKLDLAESEYQRAKLIFDGYPSALCRIYLDLGNIALQRSDWKTMDEFYDLAEIGFTSENASDLLADLEINRGTSLCLRGDYETALDHFNKAVSVIQSKKDAGRLGSCYLDIAIAQMELNCLQEAMESIRLALGHAQEAMDANLELTVYISRVKLSLYLRDLMVAQYYAEMSLEMAENMGNEFSKAEIYKQLGEIAREDGKYEDSMGWLKKAVELSRKIDNRSTLAESLIEMGRLFVEKNDIENAKKRLLEAKEIAKKFRLENIFNRSTDILEEIN